MDYIWASNAVRSYSTRSVNGPILNMYIGQLRYYSASDGDAMITDYSTSLSGITAPIWQGGGLDYLLTVS